MSVVCDARLRVLAGAERNILPPIMAPIFPVPSQSTAHSHGVLLECVHLSKLDMPAPPWLGGGGMIVDCRRGVRSA
jgi:hypothetical protein